MKLVTDFNEYQILDLNKGKKLESWIDQNTKTNL